MFPVEIFEDILKYCDAVDLTRYKSVCSTWNAMIPRIMDQQTDIWYRKCLTDIPETMWSSMFDPQLVPAFDPIDYHKSKDHPYAWIQLWRSWISWCKLMHTEVTVESFEPLPERVFDERITCIALQNNIIAVGSSQGYLTLFDINNTDILGTIDFKWSIVDVHLFGTVECIGVMASLIDNRSRLCTVINKNVIDYYDLHMTQTAWTCSNLCNGYVSMLALSHSITTLAMITMLGDELAQMKICHIPWPEQRRLPKAVGVEAYGDRILLWTEGNTHWIYSFHEGTKSIYLTVKQPRVPIRRYQTFKPFVVACIGELGEFGFCINGSGKSNEWKMYNLFKKFRAPVTAVLFHVGILALGLESGEVHIFTVKDAASLQDLDFDVMESMIVRLDSKAIILLKVTEHASVPYIVAATTRSVYFMKFTSS